MFEGTVGHERQIKLLTKAVESGRLAHAYLFAGPEGVGKKALALDLAGALLKWQKKSASDFNPDLLEVCALEGEREIKIAQIRELIYKLSLKPYLARYKVAIIDEAEKINDEAANALLKSLEEPKDYTIIILITSNAFVLPKTIISRTQKINFGILNEKQPAHVHENFYKIFKNGSQGDKLLLVSEIAEMETLDIKKLLQHWLVKLSFELRSNPSVIVKEQAEQVLLSAKFLDQNLNSKLLLSNLMLNTQ